MSSSRFVLLTIACIVPLAALVSAIVPAATGAPQDEPTPREASADPDPCEDAVKRALLSAAQAHGAGDEPKPQKAPAASAEEKNGLPDISYEKARSFKRIEKLSVLQNAYVNEIDNGTKFSELLQRRVTFYRSNSHLDTIGLQRDPLIRYIRILSLSVPDDLGKLSDGDLEGMSDADLVEVLFDVYEAKSGQCTVNADRYRVSLTNINRAIVDLILEEAGVK